MRYWFFFAVILAVAIFQISLGEALRIFNVKPELLLASVVLFTLICEFRLAVALGIIAGMLKDILSINNAAVNTILFPLWSILVIQAARKISLDTPARQGCLVAVVVMMNSLVLQLFIFPAGGKVPAGIFLRTLFLEPLYTAAVVLAGLRFFKRYFILPQAGDEDEAIDLEAEIE
jgi:rod shape-determining protein MreD